MGTVSRELARAANPPPAPCLKLCQMLRTVKLLCTARKRYRACVNFDIVAQLNDVEQ